jgi:hypothetical protein
MKYKTRELWQGFNSNDNELRRHAAEQWEKNVREYQRQLEGLKPRLDEQTNRFFTTEDLHDGRLLAFTAGDDIDFSAGGRKFDIHRHNPSVRLQVLGANLDSLYRLTYSKVSRVVFDYPTDNPLFHGIGRQIGDWGYDELTAVDEDYLRHEILFASGTTILIEFQEFFSEKEKIEEKR